MSLRTFFILGLTPLISSLDSANFSTEQFMHEQAYHLSERAPSLNYLFYDLTPSLEVQTKEQKKHLADYRESVREEKEPNRERGEEAPYKETSTPTPSTASSNRAQTYYTQGELKKAHQSFSIALQEDPNNQQAFDGLLKIAKVWELKKGKRERALEIYNDLISLKPNDVNLLFYRARLYYWMGRQAKSKQALEQVLCLSPKYGDAAYLLFYVYLNQKKWDQAACILKNHQDFKDIDLLWALLAFRKGDYKCAQSLYHQVLDKEPDNINALRGLARTYAALNRYQCAKKYYQKLTSVESDNPSNWKELLNVLSHTNISASIEGSYTQARENDPDIGEPVVKDYYTYGGAYINVPICDYWRLLFKDIFFNQQEDDIYPPIGLNYNAFVYGAQATSEVYFAKNFRWDVVLRFLAARGYNDHAFFPFESTARFEPGTSFVYNTPTLFALINTHVESFIIKNFDRFKSQLLRTIHFQVLSIYRPNVYLRPELETSYTEVFYNDRIQNYQNVFQIWAKFNLFNPYLKFVYGLREENFKQPVAEYFSYKLQFRNTFGGLFTITIKDQFTFECFYRHWWQYSAALNQPIGAFVLQQNTQRIQADKVSVNLSYRYKDLFNVEAFGHLLYTTLPYRDYQVGGKLFWQF